MNSEELIKVTAENELLQFLGVKIEKASGDHDIKETSAALKLIDAICKEL